MKSRASMATMQGGSAPLEGSSNRSLREEPPRNRGLARELFRTALISAGVGLGITALIGVGNRQVYSLVSFLGGGVVGICIGLGAFGTALLLNAIARGLELPTGRSLWLVGYFIGGALGWLIGNGLSVVLLSESPWPSIGVLPIAVFGGVAVAVGLVFDTVGRLRQRLEESIIELKEREFAQKELETARAIQQRLLPPNELIGTGFRLNAINRAALIVAGDFFEYFRHSDGSLGVALGDVAGKGMGASLIMASTQAVLPLLAGERSVEEGLEALTEKLLEDLASREFVALILLRFDPTSGELDIANAGLPDPYRLRPHCAPEVLEVSGPRLPLGLRSRVGYRSLRVQLEPGDRLLLYTDGLAEGLDSQGEPMGYEWLTELVAGAAPRLEEGQEPEAWLAALFDELPSGGGEDDDRTAVLLERTR